MDKEKKKKGTDRGKVLITSILLFFGILAAVVFAASRRITAEMSRSAIDNLSESLNLIGGTIETILQLEAEHQKLMAKELSISDDPEEYILIYDRSSHHVKPVRHHLFLRLISQDLERSPIHPDDTGAIH